MADNEACNHLMNSKVPETKIIHIQYGNVAIIPYGDTMHSTYKETLKPNGISNDMRTAHLFPGLKSGALISLWKLFGDGFDMKINIRHLNIYKKG